MGMEPHIKEEARLNRSRIQAGEGSPTFGDEIVPPNILHPAAALTPVLQSLRWKVWLAKSYCSTVLLLLLFPENVTALQFIQIGQFTWF
jgi:hypothetical protein